MDSGGEQTEIVAELTETRSKLDLYKVELSKQDQVMQAMAQKLAEKSLEVGEVEEKCRSLRSELEKSQLATSEDSSALRSVQDEIEKAKTMIRAELEEQHGLQIAAIKHEHAEALKAARQQMEGAQSNMNTESSYDPEDVRAYREQVAMLSAQLENAYRDVDKLKRDHDKEVIQLNQQLVSTVDEYETKLMEEKALCEDLENRLEMSDTVSSEIQASFSKQLEQLEEERDTLRQQLRQSQTRAKESSVSKKQIKDLEDEVVSYQKELADATQRIEETEKAKRNLRDDIERMEESADKLKKTKSALETELEAMKDHLNESKLEMQQLNEMHEKKSKEHEDSLAQLQADLDTVTQTAVQDKEDNEKKLQDCKNEHSEELKNLHSQHHRQMDEVKVEMQRQLDATRAQMENERKGQLESVKDVHEKSRDREVVRMQEEHDAKLQELIDSHQKELKSLRIEAEEIKTFGEERLRIELKEEFENQLEKELDLLRRRLDQENELSQAELVEKHRDDLDNLKQQHKSDLECQMEEVLKQQGLANENTLQAQKAELDEALEVMKLEFKNAQETLEREHAESIAKIEADFGNMQSEKDKAVEKVSVEAEEALKQANQQREELKTEISDLQQKLQSLTEELGQTNETALLKQDSLDQEQDIRQDIEQELQSLKEELSAVQNERDQIFSQAEESQKRLAALHLEETEKLNDEIANLNNDHRQKIESMQIEIDGLRTSRTDLQDLKSQLLARAASVEDLEKMRADFAEEKESLIKMHDEEMEKIRLDHEEESRNYQEKLEQLLSDLNASQEKLADISSSPMLLESSPMRSVSAMSDYDSSNVQALNKDYRSAMTLTNVSDVSGLSETPLDEEDEEEESKDKTADEKHLEEEILKQQLEEMKRVLDEVQQELEKNQASHEEVVQSLMEDHARAMEELNQTQQQDKETVLEELRTQHEEAMNTLRKELDEATKVIKEDHPHEIMQIRLQCASDTARQVEEDTEALKKKLEGQFNVDKDLLKQQLEIEANEKLEEEKHKHQEELSKQSDEMSASMESRLAAVMAELHEQKQQSIAKLSGEHATEMTRQKDDLLSKLKEVEDKEQEISETWKKEKQDLESQVDQLRSELERSIKSYHQLTNDLETGSSEHLHTLQAQHSEMLENQRKKLEEEHEVRQEAALQKQAQVYQQAQQEFVLLHQQQLEQFTSSQKDEALGKEEETERRIEAMKEELAKQHAEETSKIQENHNEELKVVATKLVEVHEDKQQVEVEKNELGKLVDTLRAEKENELSELKSTLVGQHMAKFQEITATLEQHHKDEMEACLEEHKQEEAKLREGLIMLQKKLDAADEDLKSQLQSQQEEHETQMNEVKKQNEELLLQIEQEIQAQEVAHKEGMKKILSSQGSELEILQQQFDEALKKATESSVVETQKLAERVGELETELQETDSLQHEMEQLKVQRDELIEAADKHNSIMQNWEEERDEERKAYEEKLVELSDGMNAAKEEFQDLNSRVEFERAEYETEIESAQEEIRVKDENVKELQAEIEHKTAALNSLQQQHEQLTTCRERETQEGDNLLKMLRDDLDRLNKERDAISSANEQLLSTLSELVTTNQKCEEVIAKKLEALPIMGTSSGGGASDAAENSATQFTSSTGEQSNGTDATTTPVNTSLSGSFVDEGLELSQRLAESMFVGPELDSSAREVVTGSGTRVGQAVERLLDMLNNTVQQLNAAQQAQTILGDELQRVVEEKAKNQSEQNTDADVDMLVAHLKQQVDMLETELAERNKAMENQEKDNANVIAAHENWLAEEKSLLQRQREALVDGRDETEINLLRATEELANEKQMLVEQQQKERDRLEEAARQLEQMMEEESQRAQDQEQIYLNQIEDLKTQISALSKQNESDNRFNAELVTDREAEREQFEQMMETMRNEIDQARDTAKTESVLAEKVAHLEEDLETKQQQHQEAQDQVDKLQSKIGDLENLIEELKDQAQDDQELETLRNDATKTKNELEESRRQHDVLQQELYDNMLRISALEAQLDNYRHGVDEQKLVAAGRAQVEDMILEEQKDDIEDRDSQIAMLAEQQNNLRTQLIEKEEQVEKLLRELDQSKDMEVDNAKLKEKIEELRNRLNEDGGEPQQQSTQSEQLEALSRHLLEEKNAEIDELRQQMSLLRSDTCDGDLSVSEQIMSSLKDQLEDLAVENEQLKLKLQSAEQQLTEALEQNALQEENVQQAVKDNSENVTDVDTGIHEVDLTVGDLTRQEEINKLLRLEEENRQLKEALENARSEAERLVAEAEKDIFNLPPRVKELIRDLEERLNKEEESDGGSASSSDSSSDDDYDKDEENVMKLTHKNNVSSDLLKKPRKSKDSNVVREKLMEIEQELRENTPGVLSHILKNKYDDAKEQNEILKRLENQLDESEKKVATLTQQVAELQNALHAPDVCISMRDEDLDDKSDRDVHVDQKPDVPVDQEDSSSSSDSEDDVDEMKIQLDAKEKEIQMQRELISESAEKLEFMQTELQELKREHEEVIFRCEKLETEVAEKSEELEALRQKLVDEETGDNISQEDVSQDPEGDKQISSELEPIKEEIDSDMDSTEKLNDEVEELNKKLISICEDRDRVSKQLNDVQRECTALLDDNNRLEDENKKMEERDANHVAKIQELEDLITERENELQQAQMDAAELQQNVNDLAEDLQNMESIVQTATSNKMIIQEELHNKSIEYKQTVANLQNEVERLAMQEQYQHARDGSGDGQNLHADKKQKSFELETEVDRLNVENETLREEVQSLTFKTDELQTELDATRQSHVDEIQLLQSQHESEMSHLQLRVDEMSLPLQPQIVEEELLQKSPSELSRKSSSSSSKSPVEEIQSEIAELREKHERKMEEIQNKFAAELKEAVESAVKEQEERSEARVAQLEEKHKKEVNDILSESMSVDNELARRLRDELDLADKLDNNLLNQLQTLSPEDDSQSQLNLSSPEKDAEISVRLQHLLSRLHNEGVQVLSLSELQFIKHHQSYLNSSAQTTSDEPEEKAAPDPPPPSVDIEALKRAWENEKLALLDAIQALKELLTQTAQEVAQFSDDDDNLRWRGDFLRAIADLFERERRALLAELQASVIEAHGEAESNEQMSTASRLEELERKIRSQQTNQQSTNSRVWDLTVTSELLRLRHEIRRLTSLFTSTAQRDLQHRSELERLLAADRDQLVEDIKQLKIDRKEQLEQVQNRVQELQEQMRNNEDAARQAQSQLKQQIELLNSRLQQEQALTEDLRTSLDNEQQKSRGMLPALERARERTCELSSEIVAFNEGAARAEAESQQQIETLKLALDETKQKLDGAEQKLRNTEDENSKRTVEIEEARKEMENALSQDENMIKDLQDALATEETRRREAMSAVEAERQNVTKLHQELANERATAYDDVIQLKNRCDDLSAAVKSEQERCQELRGALEREAIASRQAREALESERAVTAEGRAQDRATVTDLQNILDEAKQETERMQSRVQAAEHEKALVIRNAEEMKRAVNEKLEQERMSRDEAVTRERRARIELQSALEAEKAQNREAHHRIRALEEQQNPNDSPSPAEMKDSLLANRRQLESLRQRLQMETSKLQNLVDRSSHRPPSRSSRDHTSPSSSLLSSDGEKFESLKRSLGDMQTELKDLYTELSIPKRASQSSSVPMQFNDQLLRENAELSDYAARCASEARELRDTIADLKEDQQKQTPSEKALSLAQSPSLENQQKMATRMHKLYTRYLRAESFRKSLAYQKKYLLLLLGGFQDCEEATLALIARMGAYPSTDALRRPIPHRTRAFTRFRSAVRAVIAIQRLKFLVRKWKRASSTVSAAIQSKHGVSATTGTSSMNGTLPSQPTRHRNELRLPTNDRHAHRTPSPIETSPDHVRYRAEDSYGSQSSVSRYSSDTPVHDTSHYMDGRRGTSPHTSGAYGNYDRDSSYAAPGTSDGRHLSPSAAVAYASLERWRQGESDPSLNEYIRKLENIQHKLGHGSYRYPR
uniref:Putative leucine-rich repeat-containing protein DDB_G0290503 n=1 Tax=Phallusia mammillata TaxID=59560 RepID=A0A6F9DNU7_9ASCI|nr:putative leucine-rich repeat-containing protein DDB_G0290503 [Phallusia mammillata]